MRKISLGSKGGESDHLLKVKYEVWGKGRIK